MLKFQYDKVALKKCGGACAGEVKEGYCGVFCQKLDW